MQNDEDLDCFDGSILRDAAVGVVVGVVIAFCGIYLLFN